MKSVSHVSVDEKEKLEAQKKKETENEEKRAKKLANLKRINIVYLPLMALTFVLIFWIVGLRKAELI